MTTKTKITVMDVYFQPNENYTVRHEELDGKDHLVVPVTMMTEGVRSGSAGPILHLAEELGRYPESWDGIPVTIGHPRVNNTYVSANSPDVLSDWAVGRVFNTHLDGTALRAEVWVCIEELERISEDTLSMLNNNEIIEVSIGIFSDEEEQQGIFENENYNAIARNYRPNHLALLPDEIGACSIENGCGIRVNKKGGTKMTEELIVNAGNQEKILKELNRQGFSINETGYREKMDKIREAVYALDGNGLDNYVEEVYDDYVVYRQSNYRVEPRITKLYKQSYQENAAGDIELAGEAVHVKRTVNYENVPNTNTSGRIKTKRIIKKKSLMANECTECVKKLADGLIANTNTAWQESDRAYLEEQGEDQLEKMTPQEPKVNVSKPTREDVMSVFSEKPMSTDEFLSLASPEVATQLREGIELRTNQKTKMVADIIANADAWTEDELNAKELPELQKVYKLVTKEKEIPTSFVAAGGSLGGQTQVQNNNKSKVVMLPKVAQVKK